MKAIDFKATTSAAASMIDEYNARFHHSTRPEGKERGQDGRKINNKEYALKLIRTIANQFYKIKNGVLRVTRSYLAKGIGRSEPSVDLLLEKLEKAGMIRRRGTAVERFKKGTQAVQCIEVEILAKHIFVPYKKLKQAIKLFLQRGESSIQDQEELSDVFEFINKVKNSEVDFEFKIAPG